MNTQRNIFILFVVLHGIISSVTKILVGYYDSSPVLIIKWGLGVYVKDLGWSQIAEYLY